MEPDTGGRGNLFRGDEVAHLTQQVEYVLLAGLGDVEHRGALAVEQYLLLVAVEAVGDAGDLAETGAGAGGAGDDHQIAEVSGALALIIEAPTSVRSQGALTE
jgi:hypothetical protein